MWWFKIQRASLITQLASIHPFPCPHTAHVVQLIFEADPKMYSLSIRTDKILFWGKVVLMFYSLWLEDDNKRIQTFQNMGVENTPETKSNDNYCYWNTNESVFILLHVFKFTGKKSLSKYLFCIITDNHQMSSKPLTVLFGIPPGGCKRGKVVAAWPESFPSRGTSWKVL